MFNNTQHYNYRTICLTIHKIITIEQFVKNTRHYNYLLNNTPYNNYRTIHHIITIEQYV